ncbi:helix-turn-helix domain-containing protein [Lactobacillus johnsonii]|nr:helix-turn-helix domain-containing protein [Lactobacillus johnsonii]
MDLLNCPSVPIASIAKKVGISRQQVYRIKKRENI